MARTREVDLRSACTERRAGAAGGSQRPCAEARGTTNASPASCASVNRGLRRVVLFVGSKQEDAQGREVTRGGRLLEQLDDGLAPAFSAALFSKERDVRADFFKRVDATVDVA